MNVARHTLESLEETKAWINSNCIIECGAAGTQLWWDLFMYDLQTGISGYNNKPMPLIDSEWYVAIREHVNVVAKINDKTKFANKNQ